MSCVAAEQYSLMDSYRYLDRASDSPGGGTGAGRSLGGKVVASLSSMMALSGQ